MARQPRSTLLLSLLSLALTLVLAGCGQQEEASFETLAGKPLPENVPNGTELVVGDQNEEVQTLMAASGEEAELTSKATFANFLGGPNILEAVRADAVDVAYVGDTPPIQAHASGQYVPIVAAVRSSEPDYQLAVRPGLRVKTLEQLEGKKIGFAEGTGRQPFVLRALQKAGITEDDVELVPLDAKDMPDAVRNGQVDVAPLNEPHFTRFVTQQGGSGVPRNQLDGLSHGLHYLSARGDALADKGKAAAIREFVQHFIAAYQWSVDNPDKWVQAYHVDTQKLTAVDGRNVVRSQGDIAYPQLDEEIIRLQQDTIDVIHEAGDLPERLDAEKEFADQFNDAIAEAVRDSGGRSELP